MDKRSDIPFRVMVAAASAERRSSLGETVLRAIHGRVHLTSDTQISLERFMASGAEILVADLETPALASSLLRFLEAAPGATGTVALMDDPDPVWVRSALRASLNAILARDAGAEDLLLALQAAEA